MRYAEVKPASCKILTKITNSLNNNFVDNIKKFTNFNFLD